MTQPPDFVNARISILERAAKSALFQRRADSAGLSVPELVNELWLYFHTHNIPVLTDSYLLSVASKCAKHKLIPRLQDMRWSRANGGGWIRPASLHHAQGHITLTRKYRT